ncbi:DUF4258 domain-containing protein (plasmid) [Azospirillum oryzae]|uniref:DUF4258 domain-containing protein n=1 Tax=Azospirillum oryzae TaxID=286727 RepID=A0A6N1B699_9PROT|nr:MULTISPECIES: DUF4258 domain-containing protein [Azospirillum]KAA0584715.1 DUF4258 domain-containing protein [Azospirillum oryzae]PWC82444.1 hypothetical protein TSO5_30715 [Azospirillum sp. TSO5]QCG99255.1 DUF4258 domain-containing protein [Azospirillum sp. TSA2s]QKS54712.1 DUF4258 domain-containing protein [Azospirillum oryzae]GLR77606.1 hypothetical protein GCM10007856_02740 [Azospirillum oryzae]
MLPAHNTRSQTTVPSFVLPRPQKPSTPAQVLLFRRPIRWSAPRLDDLARLAVDLLREEKVIFTAHAYSDRMSERDIAQREALEIISKGMPYKVEPGAADGEWRVNFSRRVGGRDAAVAVSLTQGPSPAKVVTVMWLDRR